MASLSRQDRALMRQRGAASRIVAPADFGLDFGLGNHGQDPQLARQRDTASRKVENGQVGASLPGSARSLRSTTKTPQPLRSSSRQPSRTSGTRRRRPSSIRSARHNSHEPEHGEGNLFRPQGQQVERDGHIAKRRRLSSSVVTPQQLSVGAPVAETTGTRQSRRRSSRKAFIIATDDDNGTSTEDSQLPGTTDFSQPQKSPLFFHEDESNKENDPTGNDNHSHKHSLSLPRGVKDSHTTTVSSVDAVSNTNTLVLEPVIDDGKDAEDSQEHTKEPQSGNGTQSMLVEDSSLMLDKAGPSSQTRRKKRKSVVLVRKKKRSSGPYETEVARTDIVAQSPEGSALSEGVPPLSVPAGRRRTRRSFELESRADIERSPTSHLARSPKEIEENDDGTYIQESSPEPQTPAPVKRAGKTTHHRTTENREIRASKRKGAKPTFPIVTHRLTNVSKLPTIHEASDGEGDFENARDISHDLSNDRSQPNVVDVLSQICRETIENLVERMVENTQPSGRVALKNQRSALEEFGRDLNDELFELSEAVENRINLEARVRKSKRDKTSLQTEWLELRKERERIALQCDAIRRQHWEVEHQARERWDLSEAARRAELELERNNESSEGGLEFLLRSVVSSVSSASEAGGLLDRVRSFNSQLENVALCLERRDRD